MESSNTFLFGGDKMILNVSGRCDIVAFYTKWFMNRYHKGFLDVRNPFYPKMVSRINFSNVDAILFCTKNPLPIIPYLKEIDKPIIFHITITPYQNDIELNVIDKKKVIDGIKEISNIIGMDNIAIRYDPVFLSDKYNLEYHKKAFSRLCSLLNGHVKRIIISFLDECKNVQKNKGVLKYHAFTTSDYQELGTSFSKIAKDNDMTVQTCFEDNDLVQYGFIKEDCLSHQFAYQLTGKTYPNWKARKGNKCHCVEMVDIGEYNSCKHFCKYCYANFDEDKVLKNFKNHNLNSSLLIGELESDDIIKERIK